MMLKSSLETVSQIMDGAASASRDGSGDLFITGSLRSERRHEVFRAEPSDGIVTPHIVLPHHGDAEDFFATTATFYQAQAPVTALTHVLGRETAELFADYAKGKSRKRARPLDLTPITGTIIGEALASQPTADGVPTYAACRRTLTFALFRAALLHGRNVRPIAVVDRWVRLRELSRARFSGHTIESVLAIHSIIEPTLDGSVQGLLPDEITSALRLFLKNPASDSLSQALTQMYPGLKGPVEALKGAFDGRMAAFAQILEVIRNENRGTRANEIAAAYFCDQILAGSFAHAEVLNRLAGQLPDAAVWYGFFAATTRGPGTRRHASGLENKLRRDLAASFAFEDRPTCDISLDELEILLRAEPRNDAIRPSFPRTALVSIYPGVDVLARLDTGIKDDHARARSVSDESSAAYKRATRLLEEALSLIRRADSRKAMGGHVGRELDV